MKKIIIIFSLLTLVMGQAQVVPSGLKIEGGKKMLASIYDDDYMPYKKPTGKASWNRNSSLKRADGNRESKAIDYQGRIPADGISVRIPVSVSTQVNLPAFSQTKVIDAYKTENNKRSEITFSWEAQKLTNKNKYILAKIKPRDGVEILIKKLDINADLGNDFEGLELVGFNYSSNNNGNIVKYELRVVPGIPDRNFSEKTIYNGNDRGYVHRFLYLPVQFKDGKTWLNNNLGADYSNVDSEHFNLVKEAESRRDYHAYGSFFVFGREADGHELMVWEGVNIGDRKFKDIGPIDNKGLPIIDVCPDGFHTPTIVEFKKLIEAYLGYKSPRIKGDYFRERSSAIFVSDLSLPAAGALFGGLEGVPYSTGMHGIYWATRSGVAESNTFVYATNSSSIGGRRTEISHTVVSSVRCIQD